MKKQRKSEIMEDFILKKVDRHPHDLAAQIMARFRVTRTTAFRHIHRLLDAGLLLKTGKNLGVSYHRPHADHLNLQFPNDGSMTEMKAWETYFQEKLMAPRNIEDIARYAFTEMMNNAIDHSNSKRIETEMHKEPQGFRFVIRDHGIGLVQKLKNHLKTDSGREALFHLMKGKITTDPANHSGEGIFFSSRAVDLFQIRSNGLMARRDNSIQDWEIFEDPEKQKFGTEFQIFIKQDHQGSMLDAFEKYQNNEDDLRFHKTDVNIQLSRFGSESFISRSEAKRVAAFLEPFDKVVLDFKGIRSVGQGFVDELFRVFPNARRNPIEFLVKNANPDIRFMIDRTDVKMTYV